MCLQSCPDFVSAAGPDQLTDIGGSVLFTDLTNEAFTSFVGFNNVARVGGSTTFEGLSKVVSFDGFNAVTRVGDAVEVKSLRAMTDFKGFEKLERIDGEGSTSPTTNDLYFYYTQKAANFHGSFGELDYVGGGIYFSNAMVDGGITSGKLFPKLREVLGGFKAHDRYGNAVGSAGVHFPALEIVGETLHLETLYANGLQVEMAGAFPKLKQCKNIQLNSITFYATGNASVFGALEEVEEIEFSTVRTSGCNPAPSACHIDLAEWFPVLKTVTKQLRIGQSPAITGFGFKSLESVGKFAITGNPKLAICRSEYDQLVNSVTKSSATGQIVPGTFIESC